MAEENLIVRSKNVSSGLTLLHPITIDSGKNAYLYDTSGKKNIDFTIVIGVTNLGHCNPELVKAKEQHVLQFGY
jgi:4-aminobutyrate aminotransferase/(S)-3-amino-2-methylpropionate transaminase